MKRMQKMYGHVSIRWRGRRYVYLYFDLVYRKRKQAEVDRMVDAAMRAEVGGKGEGE